jgi:hypothetical protein
VLTLFIRAYVFLIYFDFYLAKGNFAALYDKVRNHRLRNMPCSEDMVQKICAAVDLACIWYWKEVLCLQRSAVTTCLLRQHGVSAQLFIGAQRIPFRAHAWVEVDGRVVNDKPYMRDMYAVLDRC